MDYVTPAGFRDVLSDEACMRERIARDVQACFAARGYLPIETPTLEVMDVMRAGGRMPGSPFKFFDASGDLLAMRPDVTLQVARMCATRLAGQPGPFRFRYMQRVFREAEGRMQAQAREMTQIGVECIGEAGPQADAEVVELMAEALELAGARGCKLALARVGVLRALLAACGASAQWTEQVLAAFHASNFVEVDRLTGEAAAVPPVFAAAIRALPRIRGGREAVEEVRALVAPLGCEDGLDDFARTCDLLAEAGLADRILVDFSVMSSFDYYTGIVFEAYAPELGTPLGSGGRYDNMIGSYGESRPAAGFAFSLEQAMAAAAAAERSVDDEAARPLRIAVPKGSLNADTVAALEAAGLDTTGLDDPGRQLHRTPASSTSSCGYRRPRSWRWARIRHLRQGLAPGSRSRMELVDLARRTRRGGRASRRGGSGPTRYRASDRCTKYPGITAPTLPAGQEVEIVKLHGNIELAPLTGMAERIVDITATGTTLKENDLVVVDEVLSSTARFFSNTCAFRTDARIVQLANTLQRNAEASASPAGEEKE
ncbi:MAG: ATP phosphoribosyltransferase regulatory subunit [Eggerthella lenta]